MNLFLIIYIETYKTMPHQKFQLPTGGFLSKSGRSYPTWWYLWTVPIVGRHDNSTHLSLSLRLKSRRVCLVTYSSMHMFQVTGRLLWWTWCELISRSPASRQVEVPASFGWEVRLVTSPMCSLFWQFARNVMGTKSLILREYVRALKCQINLLSWLSSSWKMRQFLKVRH